MKTFDATTVSDVMHEGVVTCDVDEPLTSVARTMAQHRIHCVVVWEEPVPGTLFGYALDLRWDGLMEAGARLYPLTAYQLAFGLSALFVAVGVLGAFLVKETYCRDLG